MARLMERRGLEARPHGFRTSLRTWLAEETDAPHEVAEMVLAHVADSKVVRTYRKTDFLDQRRLLMERWAEFCTSSTGSLRHDWARHAGLQGKEVI
jgi:integrase